MPAVVEACQLPEALLPGVGGVKVAEKDASAK